MPHHAAYAAAGGDLEVAGGDRELTVEIHEWPEVAGTDVEA